MARYTAKLSDGRTVTLEADAPPSEQDVLKAVSAYQEPSAEPHQYEPEPGTTAPETGAFDDKKRESDWAALNTILEREVPTPKPKAPQNVSTTAGGPPVKVASYAETIQEPGEMLTEPRVNLPRFQIKEGDPAALTIGKEVANIAAGIPEFMTSDLGVVGLAAGAGAPVATGAAFTVDMLKSLGEQIQSAYKNWAQMTPTQKQVAVTDIAGTGGFAALLGVGTAKAALKVDTLKIEADKVAQANAPATAEALKQTADTLPGTTKPKDISETQGQEKGLQEVAPTVPETAPSISTKGEQNAVPLEKSGEVDVRNTPENGPGMGTQNRQPEVPPVEGGTKETPPQEIVGMGGASAGFKTPAAQIEQLSEQFKAIQGKKVPLAQKLKEQWDVATSLSPKDAIGKAVDALKFTRDWAIEKWKNEPKIDDMLRAKGDLSASIESRGWRVRQFAKQVEDSIPDRKERAAISKWVDAGGDEAALRQGLAETKPEFKQAYQDALNLKGDALMAAKHIRQYFESRLDEAIDAGVLQTGVEDYIHRIYASKPKAQKAALAYVQSGILKANPALAKKRVFQFDWEAEKLGYKPVRDFLPRVAEYEAALSRAIASREFIKKMTTMKAADGRPIVDVKGIGVPVENQKTGVREATLIKPSFNPSKTHNPTLPSGAPNPNYRSDYVNREYPALSKWKWAGLDAADKPIYLQGDVAIHPDYVKRVDALLKPSWVRQQPVLRGALQFGSGVKQTMLDFSGFHQVQIAVHAMEHRVQPGRVGVPGIKAWTELPQMPFFTKAAKELDLSDPKLDGLLRGGLTLGGEYHAGHLGEGLVGRSISRHIPFVGPLMETYHGWLFQDFIPRVKATMAMHALERNMQRYGGTGSGKLTPEQIYFKTASEANAAFGELNYTMLERSKTAQDMARLILLAPDFLEARGRFAGAALTKGGKGNIAFNQEQRAALLLGAFTMYLTARIANKMISGQYHNEPDNLFSVVIGNKSYHLRTVQGDVLKLIEHPIEFWLSRLNPVYGRTALEGVTGRDYFGRKRTMLEQGIDAISTAVPITGRFAIERERTLKESIFSGMGVNSRRFNDVDDAYKIAEKWRKKNLPALKQETGEFIYDPNKDILRPLKIALSDGDDAAAVGEIAKLVKSGIKIEDVTKRINKYNKLALVPKANKQAFLGSLSEDEKKTIASAEAHRHRIVELYHAALKKYRNPDQQ